MTKNKVSRRAEKQLTRRQAEDLIAGSSDPAFLAKLQFSEHKNKHVKAKAKYKLAKLSASESAAPTEAA
jgi:hypothetical protein